MTAGRAAPCSARSARPHSRGGGPRCRDDRRKPALSADVDTRSLAAKTGKLDNVAPGQRLGHGHSVASYSLSGTRGQKKRPHRPLANTDTARPRHASLYTFKSSGSRTRSGPATSPPSTDSGGLAKPRSLARWYRGGETNALNGDPGATGALALKTLCLPALRPHGWRSSGRCWSTRATSHHTLLPLLQSTSQNTAGPIFSWSRLAQISKTPGLLLPVMPASGALRLVRWLNRSPCEGRRRKGTL